MATHERAHVQELRRRLEEAEEALRAIRSGEVDALMVDGPEGPRVYTLQGADRSYRAMIEAMQQGAACLCSKGIILYCNRSLADMVTRPPERIVGTKLAELLPESELASFQAMLRQAHSSGVSGELLLGAAEGAARPVQVALNPLSLPDTLVICMIVTDLTEQKRHQDLQETNHAKDVFLATLSHEMRTPLSAIMGWVSILRGEGCTEEDVQEGLEVIERNTRAQAQLIADVLDVSRIVAGNLRLDIRRCDLTEIIHAALDAVRPTAEAKRIRIEADLDPALNGFPGDPDRLQQVVWNLLSNAVKFTPDGGAITVRLSRDASDARIEISDTGAGLTPAFLPHVFDPFRQADSSTRRRAGGLGLGLSIVKQLVELHGGTVEAHSLGEGRGSTFVVSLPFAAIDGDETCLGEQDRESETAVSPALQRMRLEGLRIVVVDDEGDARRLLTKVLGDAGAVVTAVGAVSEALRAVEEVKPHVLVSDIAMPDVDGHDLIRQVRGSGHTGQSLPAVALTAFADREYETASLMAGFQVHVAKPVDPDELIAVVGNLAGRAGV